jgi:hypothetical protein
MKVLILNDFEVIKISGSGLYAGATTGVAKAVCLRG